MSAARKKRETPAPPTPAPAATAASPKSPKTLRLALGAALVLGTLLLFARVCGSDFDFVNYDDPDYVTANEHVKAGLSAAGARWALTANVASNWHPLTWMSHMLDWSLFGPNARGHHATSVLLHALNALLAFLAFHRLTGALWASAFCAALFAWHPLRAESVAWVAERKDVLSGFFFFITLWAYAVYADRRRARAGGTIKFYLLALIAFALGLMSKPMLVTLPCVLLLLDLWPLGRIPGVGADLRAARQDATTPPALPEWPGLFLLEKLPFFALTAASCVVTYLVQKESGAVTSALSLGARLENAVVAVVRYLGKFFAPFDLAVLYPHPGEWPGRKVVACLVILVAITALAALQFRRRPWLAIGWLWFLGMLVPVVGIVQVGLQAMADRYTYLTLLGVELMLVWTLRERLASAAARQMAGLAAAVVLLFCLGRTWHQLGVWKNSFTLFDHAIAVTANNYVAHDNRGLFLYKSGKVDEALADYRAALAINSGYLNANNNLGHALYELGRPAEAIPLFRTALKSKPDHLEVRNNLANALSDTGALDEAMAHYDFVLARQPNHVNALNGSGAALAMRGKLPEAKARMEKSLALAPDNASAHNNLGNVCSMLSQLDEAARHYREAARLQPNAHTHAVLGFTLSQLGRREEAIRELKTALQLQPNHAQAKAWLEAVSAAR